MSDDQIQQQVEDALDWAEPVLDGSRIDVTVDQGVVTLRGAVNNLSEKLTAERVALQVRGVEAVINELAVSSAEATEASESRVRSFS